MSTNSMRRKNTPLSLYQKSIIKFCTTNGQTALEIQQLDELRREDGSPCRLDTIKYWMKRVEDTGDIQTKSRSGRPKALNHTQTNEMVKMIEKDDEVTYPEIADQLKKKFKVDFKPRTVNDYALKEGYSKCSSLVKHFLKIENLSNCQMRFLFMF